jgi:hypothetical protein
MRESTLLVAAAGFALACSLCCAAQEKGYWRAASHTAAAITSDITISNDNISIDFFRFPLAQIRTLGPAEVSAVFDADANGSESGTLYRLSVPASMRFLHHNTLCGSEDTQWMAAYVTGRTLQVAFFSGSDSPVFTFDAISKSPDLCGTFSYAR